MKKLWEATLSTGGPNYSTWHHVLGSDHDVPLKSPASYQAVLGDNPRECYAVDWNRLSTEQQNRLVTSVAEIFKADPAQIRGDLERDREFPIRADDVSVSFSLRAFI